MVKRNKQKEFHVIFKSLKRTKEKNNSHFHKIIWAYFLGILFTKPGWEDTGFQKAFLIHREEASNNEEAYILTRT